MLKRYLAQDLTVEKKKRKKKTLLWALIHA